MDKDVGLSAVQQTPESGCLADKVIKSYLPTQTNISINSNWRVARSIFLLLPSPIPPLLSLQSS